MADNAILVHLFRHNLWANDRIVLACSGLSASQLEQEVVGTYGPLSATLVHLARAQGGYLKTLTSWQPGPEHRLEYDEPFPGLERVGWHLRFTGERLIEVAGKASADRVVEGVRDGRPYRYPEWVVLLQAAVHATEHRQQVATSLAILGMETPEPDVWAFWDEVRPPES